jgi:hypothetical protein
VPSHLYSSKRGKRMGRHGGRPSPKLKALRVQRVPPPVPRETVRRLAFTIHRTFFRTLAGTSQRKNPFPSHSSLCVLCAFVVNFGFGVRTSVSVSIAREAF